MKNIEKSDKSVIEKSDKSVQVPGEAEGTPNGDVPGPRLPIIGWRDQHGRLWVEFRKGNLSQLHPVGSLAGRSQRRICPSVRDRHGHRG